MAWPRSLAPLRHRRYAALWVGAFASNIGTWMETVGVGHPRHGVHGSGRLGGARRRRRLPPEHARPAPLGGALADRMPRRRILLCTTTVQTVLAGTLAALASVGAAHPWAVTLIVFVSGCANALGLPSFQALMPDLVPQRGTHRRGRARLGAVEPRPRHRPGARRRRDRHGRLRARVRDQHGQLPRRHRRRRAAAPAPAQPDTRGEHPPLDQLRRTLRLGRPRHPGDHRVPLVQLAARRAVHRARAGRRAPRVPPRCRRARRCSSRLRALGAVVMALLLGTLVYRFGQRRTVLGNLAVLPVGARRLRRGAHAGAGCGRDLRGRRDLPRLPVELHDHRPAARAARAAGTGPRRAMVLLGLLYPLGSVVQGALADTFGLRAVTAATAVLLAVALLAVRALRRGFDRELDDVAPPRRGLRRRWRRRARGAAAPRSDQPRAARAGSGRAAYPDGSSAEQILRRLADLPVAVRATPRGSAASTAGSSNGARARTARRRTVGDVLARGEDRVEPRRPVHPTRRPPASRRGQPPGASAASTSSAADGVAVGLTELAGRPGGRLDDGDVGVAERGRRASSGRSRQPGGVGASSAARRRTAASPIPRRDTHTSAALAATPRRTTAASAAARARGSGSSVTAAGELRFGVPRQACLVSEARRSAAARTIGSSRSVTRTPARPCHRRASSPTAGSGRRGCLTVKAIEQRRAQARPRRRGAPTGRSRSSSGSSGPGGSTRSGRRAACSSRRRPAQSAVGRASPRPARRSGPGHRSRPRASGGPAPASPAWEAARGLPGGLRTPDGRLGVLHPTSIGHHARSGEAVSHPSAEPPPHPPGRSRRRRVLQTIATIVGTLLVVAAVAAAGHPRALRHRVAGRADAAHVPDRDGERGPHLPAPRASSSSSRSQVTTSDPNLYSYVFASLDGDDAVVGSRTCSAARRYAADARLNTLLMDNSQNAAKEVALRRLGYPVTPTGDQALVARHRVRRPVRPPSPGGRHHHRGRRASRSPPRTTSIRRS